jgi:hypothetical protein
MVVTSDRSSIQELSMRFRRLLAAAVLPLAFAPRAEAQAVFEGSITYDAGMAGMNMQITQLVKGSMVRQEMEGPMGQIVTIVDTESSMMTTLMPAQKMYMRIDMNAMMQQYGQQAAAQPQPKPADFKSTGEKETIAGHACEHFAFTGEGNTIDMCIAQGLGFVPFMSMSNQGMANAPDVDEWKQRFPDGFLPLAMTVTAQGQTMTMRASTLEKKSVDASLFQVPSGYTEMRGPGGDGM